ncbi:ABC transporter permease [Alicyclobacillus mali]|uniref:Cell division protein FtsX n=2 Tax=Alicyclobacillus mali (ex Roth et al. 2021) TaxID=1123961 RepID=A0ABS0F5L1_9BACL|nr:permease-like cell division protein FtsX [Alicyclobacillus mali (ex Roth et al. 2021)]MBF8378548.1 ABC transporter permease [Alicyclobacillus mali (ex Roth et al. 2021)]MCL6489589.1 permease-like cell division protein FtsX [Alicyclobacillus mali (ex Roth et al. 2021)]
MMTRWLRHVREGFKNVIRNGWMSFAALSAVIVTLAVLGFSLILTFNVAQMSNSVTGQLEFSAFLNVNASEQQGEQVAQEIRALPGIASVQIISKNEGLQQMKQELGQELSDVLNAFKQNPLPIQIVVKPQDPHQIDRLAKEVSEIPGVAAVRDPHKLAAAIFRTLAVVRDIGIVFVVGLVVTSMFLISNTIRMTIFHRRREIEIMKLVGATNWFIRWPFIIEGMIIGLIGSAIPVVLLVYGYRSLYVKAKGVFSGLAFPLVQAGQIEVKLAVILIAMGLLIGMWGGVITVRRFLRV